MAESEERYGAWLLDCHYKDHVQDGGFEAVRIANWRVPTHELMGV